MTPTTWWQVIGSIVALALVWTTWWFKRTDDQKKAKYDLDKEIDNADSIVDFIRIDDKLRNK